MQFNILSVYYGIGLFFLLQFFTFRLFQNLFHQIQQSNLAVGNQMQSCLQDYKLLLSKEFNSSASVIRFNSENVDELTRDKLNTKQLQSLLYENVTKIAEIDTRFSQAQILYNTPWFQSTEICVPNQCCARSFIVPQRSEEFTPLGNFSPREVSEIRVLGRTHPPKYLEYYSSFYSPQHLPCLQPGVVIQVDGNMIQQFFEKLHPHIQVPYVLFAGDTQHGPNLTKEILSGREDPKLVHFFAHHIESYDKPHIKYTPVPLGTSQWKPHRPYFQQLLAKTNFQNPFASKKYKQSLQGGKLFVSFGGDYANRSNLFKHFCSEENPDKPEWVVCRKRMDTSVGELYTDMAGANISFVLSPRGTGPDAYRTWEAYFLGYIPIVHKSVMPSIYDDLPVIALDSFMIDFEHLRQIMDQYTSSEQFLSSRFSGWERLFVAYWRRKSLEVSGRLGESVVDPETQSVYHKLWKYETIGPQQFYSLANV